VRLELWRGVTNDAERKTLRRYEALLPDYEISAAIWNRSIQLADRARASGVIVPLADLLIFACATDPRALRLRTMTPIFDELSQLET
jgi:predicted nucleic acid-binding protein